MIILKSFSVNKFFLLLIAFVFIVFTATTQDVYKTPGGNRYHLASCRMVKNVSEKITLAVAQKSGLTPCLICKPASGNDPRAYKTAKGKTTTVQCNGFTKARNRCLHKTSIGNGFCYQHQPG